jgi:Na+/proline symporter
LSGLVQRIDPGTLSLIPDFGDWGLTLSVLVIPLTVQWWSVWYPGAEPGGGSYIAQRMLASKSERDALAGTLFFNVAHYALRSWPWIIVALASILVYPTLADIGSTFPYVDPALIGHDMAYPAMLRFLPVGWLGLMVAGLLAAYVSTIATHLNWGTSYLVHDFYRRFLKPEREEKHYVLVGRLVTALLMLLAGLLTFRLQTASKTFQLLLSIGAGTGLIYLLRWFWWRINAWSEISAMASSFLTSLILFLRDTPAHPVSPVFSLLVTVAVTTVVWVTVTLFTEPANRETLIAFYRLVRPAGPGWKPIAALAGPVESPDSLPQSLLGWVLGCTFIYAALFGTGSFIYGKTAQGLVWLVLFVVSGVGLLRLLPRLWSRDPAA